MPPRPAGRGPRCPCTRERRRSGAVFPEEHDHVVVCRRLVVCGCPADPLCLPHVRCRAAGPALLRNGLAVPDPGGQGGDCLLRRGRQCHGCVRADQRLSLPCPRRSGRPVRAAPGTASHGRRLRGAADRAGPRDSKGRRVGSPPGRPCRSRRCQCATARSGDEEVVERPGPRPGAAATRVQPGRCGRGASVRDRAAAGGRAGESRRAVGGSCRERRPRMGRGTDAGGVPGGPQSGVPGQGRCGVSGTVRERSPGCDPRPAGGTPGWGRRSP